MVSSNDNIERSNTNKDTQKFYGPVVHTGGKVAKSKGISYYLAKVLKGIGSTK